MEFSLLTKELVASSAECERACLKEAWSENAITDMLTGEGNIYFTCAENGVAVGIAGAVCACGEANITNVAVLPDCRRRGIAERLMRLLLEECRIRGCEVAFLEVALGNEGAISLYKKLGFEKVGVRKHFYGSDDALILRCDIR